MTEPREMTDAELDEELDDFAVEDRIGPRHSLASIVLAAMAMLSLWGAWKFVMWYTD